MNEIVKQILLDWCVNNTPARINPATREPYYSREYKYADGEVRLLVKFSLGVPLLPKLIGYRCDDNPSNVAFATRMIEEQVNAILDEAAKEQTKD